VAAEKAEAEKAAESDEGGERRGWRGQAGEPGPAVASWRARGRGAEAELVLGGRIGGRIHDGVSRGMNTAEVGWECRLALRARFTVRVRGAPSVVGEAKQRGCACGWTVSARRPTCAWVRMFKKSWGQGNLEEPPHASQKHFSGGRGGWARTHASHLIIRKVHTTLA
jgi:hypothetical protein